MTTPQSITQRPASLDDAAVVAALLAEDETALNGHPSRLAAGEVKALLLHSFREFQRRGKTRVTLGVDAENPTGATKLYDSVGMHVEMEAVVFEKTLA